MNRRFESLASSALAIAAVAIALVLVHREFFGSPGSAVGNAGARPSGYDAEWTKIVEGSLIDGKSDARIKLIEFADLECPFCAKFNTVLRQVKKEYPNQVAIVFVHFPIPAHRFARSAARAVECADERTRFALIDLLYAKQDSLGFKPWIDFAREAGVNDMAQFSRCVAQTTKLPRVEAGVALGMKFKVVATPTVFINGWRYPYPPDFAEISRRIGILLNAKTGTSAESLANAGR